jgi:hypothetical protein
MLSSLRAQRFSDFSGQLSLFVGLRHYLGTIRQATILRWRAVAIARREQHLQTRGAFARASRQVRASHAARHDDICKQKVDVSVPIQFY